MDYLKNKDNFMEKDKKRQRENEMKLNLSLSLILSLFFWIQLGGFGFASSIQRFQLNSQFLKITPFR